MYGYLLGYVHHSFWSLANSCNLKAQLSKQFLHELSLVMFFQRVPPKCELKLLRDLPPWTRHWEPVFMCIIACIFFRRIYS